MFKVTHMVMRYAPVGVFALISVTVATFGFASPWPLAKLVIPVLLRDSVLRAGGAGYRGAGMRAEHLDPDSYPLKMS